MSLKEFIAKDRRALEEAYIKGNLDAIAETHAPDFITHAPPFPDTKGMEAFRQSVTAARQAFTNFRWDWDETISEGNTIAHRYTMRMKHIGTHPLIPVPPTGKEVFIKGCSFLHVKNGKIVEIFQCDDWLGFFQQLGVVPPMGQK